MIPFIVPEITFKGHSTSSPGLSTTDRKVGSTCFGLTEIAGQDNDGQPNLQGLTLQDRKMTDKLAGPDIAGQTSQACRPILSELSK